MVISTQRSTSSDGGNFEGCTVFRPLIGPGGTITPDPSQAIIILIGTRRMETWAGWTETEASGYDNTDQWGGCHKQTPEEAQFITLFDQDMNILAGPKKEFAGNTCWLATTEQDYIPEDGSLKTFLMAPFNSKDVRNDELKIPSRLPDANALLEGGKIDIELRDNVITDGSSICPAQNLNIPIKINPEIACGPIRGTVKFNNKITGETITQDIEIPDVVGRLDRSNTTSDVSPERNVKGIDIDFELEIPSFAGGSSGELFNVDINFDSEITPGVVNTLSRSGQLLEPGNLVPGDFEVPSRVCPGEKLFAVISGRNQGGCNVEAKAIFTNNSTGETFETGPRNVPGNETVEFRFENALSADEILRDSIQLSAELQSRENQSTFQTIQTEQVEISTLQPDAQIEQ